MADWVSRTSLILDLTDFAALDERVSVEPRPAPIETAASPARHQQWLAALVVIGAAAGVYHWGMCLLATWQWQ
jgi:hypothetical protein